MDSGHSWNIFLKVHILFASLGFPSPDSGNLSNIEIEMISLLIKREVLN